MSTLCNLYVHTRDTPPVVVYIYPTMARPSHLSKFSLSDLHSEMQRRQRAAGGLVKRRDALLKKLADMEASISAAGIAMDGGGMGGGMKRGRGRPRKNAPGMTDGTVGGPKARGGRGGRRAVNDVTLPEALAKVMAGKTMGVAEAADAVKASGYKTYSSNFRVQVNIALTKNPKLFRRVERGQYTAK